MDVPERIIERVERPTVEEFEARFARPRRPVVITGGMKEWAAPQRWTTRYLRETAGHLEANVYKDKSGKRSFTYGGLERNEHVPMKLADYIALLEERDASIDRYMRQIDIRKDFPQLLADFSRPPYYASGTCDINFWYSPRGFVTACHQDFSPNLLGQVTGRKRLILFAPTEWRKLYPPSIVHGVRFACTAGVDVRDPDYTKHPSFRDATRWTCTLETTDMVYIPTGWWHEVEALTTGISLNFFFQPPLRDLLNAPMARIGAAISLQSATRFIGRVTGYKFPEARR